MKKPFLAILASSLLEGCTFAPSINVLGAYFPDWLFCIVAGVSLTVLVHVVGGKTKLGPWMTPAALTYPMLTTLFSLAAWLIFFQN
ncbi:MAG TPA: YtcA family lipoprotein [Burkholderiales bacterium]|nr:YtcA family lipoprotein [Burkholderiales bacterium]